MDIPSASAKTGTSVALLTGRRATLKRRKMDEDLTLRVLPASGSLSGLMVELA